MARLLWLAAYCGRPVRGTGLAAGLGYNIRSAERWLRQLVAQGWLRRSSKGFYVTVESLDTAVMADAARAADFRPVAAWGAASAFPGRGRARRGGAGPGRARQGKGCFQKPR